MNYSFNHNENAAGAAPGILDRVFSFFVRRKSETLYQRFLRYQEEAHRDGVMGGGRYTVYRYTSLELRDRYELLKAAFD